MKNWLIASAVIMVLFIGCQTGATTKMPGEVSLKPGPGQIKAPWAGFNEGAWVQYQRVNLADNTTNEYRQSIHKIARGEAVIVTAVKKGDKWDKIGMDPVSLFPVSMSSKESISETIKIGSKALSCKVADMSVKMGEKPSSLKMWMCDEIPGGIAKQEKDGKVFWQVVDFGLESKAPSLEQVADIKSPWANFPKGSWVHYKVMNPADEKEYQQKSTIIDISKDKVVIEVSILEGDKWTKQPPSEMPLTMTVVPKDRGTSATLNVKDRKINCICEEKTVQMKDVSMIIKQWTSDDVPGGLVRKEMAGKVVLEVIDFGVAK